LQQVGLELTVKCRDFVVRFER